MYIRYKYVSYNTILPKHLSYKQRPLIGKITVHILELVKSKAEIDFQALFEEACGFLKKPHFR